MTSGQYQSTRPAHLPVHSSSSRDSPNPSQRVASASSASPHPTLSPAINLVSSSSSFPPNNNPMPPPQDRPFSTTSNSTIDSTTSSHQSNVSIPRRHGQLSRHGPLPTPPPDAFRPARRTPKHSDGAPSERAESMLGEEMLTSGKRSPDGRRSPSFSSTRQPTSSSASNEEPASSSSPNVVRHSLVDSPAMQRAPSPNQLSPTNPTSSQTRPTIPPSISNPPSSPPFSQQFAAFSTPTITAPSPPTPEAPSKFPTSTIGPSPSFSGLPLEPSPARKLDASTVADQTLSTLRKSENNISRRASQRYSTYQIGKIMDNGGLGASTGKKSDRRGSDINGLLGPGDKTSSPSRPARSARAVPPVPSLPVGVGASPLRNGGFIPPAQDTGVEASVSVGDPDESFSSWDVTSTSTTAKTSSTPPQPSAGPSTSTLSTTVEADEPLQSSEFLTLFLLFGRECKKCIVPPNPTVSSLRMLFMEKFEFSPGAEEFPSIYIRDPKTEWRYEWEEGEEIRDGIQLSLNIERQSNH